MKVRVMSTVMILCAALAARAQNNTQAILPYDSPVVELLNSIYLEQGKIPLTTVTPFSVEEVLLMLEKIDPASLSSAGKTAYDRITALLPEYSPPRPMDIRVAVHPSAYVEGYINTNTDPATTEWQYGYNKRKPVAELPIEFWVGEKIYGVAELSLKQNHDALNPSLVSGDYLNIPLNLTWIDGEFPFRAFIAAGGPHWGFSLGRDRFTWGNGHSGNLGLSDAPDFYEFMRLTGFWESIKYTGMFIQLWSNGVSYMPSTNAADLVESNLPRSFMLHRLDLTFWDRLNVSVCEGMTLGGVEPMLILFDPVMVFHNLFYFRYISMQLMLEVSFNPWKYMEVYGQFATNQLQIPFELQEYGAAAAAIPNAFAALGGIKSKIPLGDGYIEAGAELTYVNPWMYLRQNALTMFQWWRYLTSNVPGSSQWVSASLGYYTGPDAVVVMAWTGYDVPGLFSVKADYRLSFKGAINFSTPYQESPEAAALAAPSGIVETTHVIHAWGEIYPLDFLSVGADLALVMAANFGNVTGVSMTDFQAAVNVGVHF